MHVATNPHHRTTAMIFVTMLSVCLAGVTYAVNLEPPAPRQLPFGMSRNHQPKVVQQATQPVQETAANPVATSTVTATPARTSTTTAVATGTTPAHVTIVPYGTCVMNCSTNASNTRTPSPSPTAKAAVPTQIEVITATVPAPKPDEMEEVVEVIPPQLCFLLNGPVPVSDPFSITEDEWQDILVASRITSCEETR